MPHDPARVADTKGWLSRAATDLRAAAADLAADLPVLDNLVFHCQQAVEKAMKSLLTWQDEGATRDEAEHALAIAREAFEAILARLPETARP